MERSCCTYKYKTNYWTIHWRTCQYYHHSFKKRKDSLEGSLNRVLLAAELEFPKILVSMLPHHTSNVNIKCAGKSVWSKQLYYLHVTSFLEHLYILILIFWYNLFLIDDVWRKLCNIGCSSARATPEVSLYWSFLTLEKNIVAVIT